MAVPAAFLRSFLLAMAQQYYDGGEGEVGGHVVAARQLDRRLRFCAVAYMLLAASFFLRAGAVAGFLLWVAAVALMMLSFLHRRFPAAAVAAAHVAQAAIQPLFELLN
ncbi:hypothetical protein BRADI_4g13781v3 [Brachypodium distachyon]|uniref:PRA1 family protein n=1 Tax=Brachypodium distachyon TaxID=15368 RepID=A0A0Q3EJF6_BRADI|nr:hypothetical protein BRADI_4g13781v3 [Brachypodium distachyon]